VIDGEPLPAPTGKSQPSSREMGDSDFIVIGLIVVTVIVAIVVGGFLCAWLGRFGGSAVLGGAAGGVAWAITGAAAVGIFLAIIAFILGMVVAPRRGDSSSKWSWGAFGRAFGRFGGSAVLGGAIGGGLWAITGEAAVGIFFAIVGFILGMGGFSGGSSSGGRYSGGGSSSGGSWSGGGSSSGGGGFSGGGGSSGGGGAGGSW